MTLIEELEKAKKLYEGLTEWDMSAGIDVAIDILKNHDNWIPASQPPEKDGLYIATFQEPDGTRTVDCASFKQGQWDVFNANVIAWQPSLKPYEGE